ncbi:ABC transporter ATP-binding protein [Denitrobaculum tricleocarpae]|uniref:ABC transporter ATP-binding protein n=1 Tax=Denitrobaculum tricleocarpae TaxID=2591009 RepID=A0A545TEU4_9PROT|nr:ABC transporter ATP-binding protein [Denitrobaculum tricleocarpae]TQV75744.1 ABC transporter ATP-binding protein [Denitrobaculum tricleocarpae]
MLRVEGIETYYGPSQALFGVDLSLNEGEMVALLGRNGMGKTTTIRSICRLTPPAAGRVVFDGQDLDRQRAFRVARLGLGLVPEGRRVFANLSVEENLIATARDGDWNLQRINDLFPRLGERAGQSASTLSGGEQQMLAIGRALMTNPKLLILDEATEGLAPLIRQEIWASIKILKQQGLSILIVDKNLKDLLPLASSCVVLEKGRSVWGGSPDALAADAELQNRYLGV